MRELKIILGFIFIALIALLCLRFCKPSQEARIQVIDADTKDPIENATVDIETTDEACEEESLTTDEEGECTFTFRNPDKTLVKATASADEYESATVEDVELSYFEDDVLVIPLKPLGKANVKVVEKGTQQPIAGATVNVITKGGKTKKLTTNADGMCGFRCPKGATQIDSVLAIKNGYSGEYKVNVPVPTGFDPYLLIELEKAGTCDSGVDHNGKPGHTVQTFDMGITSDFSSYHFQFDWYTDSAPDHIVIYSGSYEEFQDGKAEKVFDNINDMATFSDTRKTWVDMKGQMLFIVVDNYNSPNSNSSTIWKYFVHCPVAK